MMSWTKSWKLTAAFTVVFLALGVLGVLQPGPPATAIMWFLIAAFNGAWAFLEYRKQRGPRRREP